MKKNMGNLFMNNEVKFKLMDINDVNRVYEIERDSFFTPWTKDAFINEMINNKIARYFLILKDNLIIGYIGIWKILDEGHITNIAIDKKYRGNKYGEMLLEYALDEMIEIGIEHFTLEVRESNEKALNLYKKFGFVVKGRRLNYYKDTKEDALLMWKSVGE